MASDKAVKEVLVQILMVANKANKSNTPEATLTKWQRMNIDSALVTERADGNCQTCSDKTCRAGVVSFVVTEAGKEFLKR